MSSIVWFQHGDYHVTIEHTDGGTTQATYVKTREIHTDAAASSCEDATPTKETEQSAD